MLDTKKLEEKYLSFWDERQIFRKSIELRPKNKTFSFFDGPPFATGLPHYGHILTSVIKDAIPRYWTMKGYRVSRVWGWDCHGLPVENLIEEELKLKTKKDIESFGIETFNEACRASVLRYTEEWKATIRRIGRWVDMDHAYKTMDGAYMESVWWVVRQLFDRGLIYEGYKSMHICPRCVTPLSNFEVTLGYKEVVDDSVVVAFPLTNAKEKCGLDGDAAVLAWTTTPWTLPGNVLLAVHPDITYSAVEYNGKIFLLAKDRVSNIFKDRLYTPLKEFKGSELLGLSYEPLFPYFKETPNAFRVVPADFVSIEEGTGVVHIAPAFGEDDYQVGEREQIPLVQHVTMEGAFVPEVTDFARREVKQKKDPRATDKDIVAYLRACDLLFDHEEYSHNYPHCWRCDTPLLNYAARSWFVRVTALKDDLLKNNEKISWVPQHMKEGRFGKWLENARDWCISRNRYWGTPVPLWKSDEGDILCVGSIKELEELSGQEFSDIHKHKVDSIVIEKNGKTYRRVPEVLDCWFESGSMPYGQMHYPFENKDAFEHSFPADFIGEGQDQTRGWFYTLHVLATALTRGPNSALPYAETSGAFRAVLVNGIILAEDGKKMSKRLKNYPEPLDIVEKHGVDALRYYLLASQVMMAENLNFSEKEVREVANKLVNTLWNSLQFYLLVRDEGETYEHAMPSSHDMDRWILSRLATTHTRVTEAMDGYRLPDAMRPLMQFSSDLSQWYVRRSRERCKSDDPSERIAALMTLNKVLSVFSRMIAPIMPFLAEEMYQQTSTQEKKESVHLEDWPQADECIADVSLELEMESARDAVELLLSLRADQNMKVRQPLQEAVCAHAFSTELLSIIAEETNVKTIRCGELPTGNAWIIRESQAGSVALNTALTPELIQEGRYREFVRRINALRKEQQLTPKDRISISYTTHDDAAKALLASFSEDLKKSVGAATLMEGEGEHELDLGGCSLAVTFQRI